MSNLGQVDNAFSVECGCDARRQLTAFTPQQYRNAMRYAKWGAMRCDVKGNRMAPLLPCYRCLCGPPRGWIPPNGTMGHVLRVHEQCEEKDKTPNEHAQRKGGKRLHVGLSESGNS
mmetsp:Transcript_3491/g.9770  ORF Transcript_3491/g.9770 Transcript_3491/m.9770 type:complete len:116 (-) Transcript_3491:472-819(-)